jgi:hypothetical protein
MTDEVEQSNWRISAGTGLVAHMPASAERRAAIAREEAKEAAAAKLEEELRQQAALERRWELERQGRVPHTHAEVLGIQDFGERRADAAERRREEAVAELLGKPAEHRLTPYELALDRKRREAEEASTAATTADVGKVQHHLQWQISKLKAAIYSATGKSPL